MLHPSIAIGKSNINERGLIATAFIPKGTVIWRLDDSAKIYSLQEVELFTPEFQQELSRYAYLDSQDRLVLLNDGGQFFNHSCNANAIDFDEVKIEIAVRDIHPGEEITNDYGLFIYDEVMICNCGENNCRKIIPRDYEATRKIYIEKIAQALKKYNAVPQPLLQGVEV